MWQLTREGLPLILSRSVCRFLKHQQFSAHLFLDCLIESRMCAWAAVLPLSVSLQSLLGSLDPCSRGGGGIAAFSVSNVRKPFPSSLETSSVGWFTQMSTWWNQIKYTLENDGPHCFSVSHPNNFIFPFFQLAAFWMALWVPLVTPAVWAAWLWIPEVSSQAIIQGRRGSFFSPQPGCGPRWNICTSICITYSHLGDFLDMRKHFYSSRYFSCHRNNSKNTQKAHRTKSCRCPRPP